MAGKARSALFVLTGAAALAGAAHAKTFSANEISFRDITGTVDLVTTSGDEIDVTIEQGGEYSRVRLIEEDGVVVVEGEALPPTDERDCCNDRIRRDVNLRDGRELTAGEPVDEAFFRRYPTIRVSMPFEGDAAFENARVRLDMDRLAGALSFDGCYVYGETGDVEEASVGLIHGSRLIMGNVAAALEADLSGDADLMTGDVEIVDIDIAGPGDVILGDVAGMMDVSIAGSGLVRAERVDAPLTVRIAGSGGVIAKSGRADALRATVDGSGGVYFNGAVRDPQLRLYGSSEIHMTSVEGRIARFGGGAVYVAGERLED